MAADFPYHGKPVFHPDDIPFAPPLDRVFLAVSSLDLAAIGFALSCYRGEGEKCIISCPSSPVT